jgi:uncharacterized protein YfaP (DUF2135 family)
MALLSSLAPFLLFHLPLVAAAGSALYHVAVAFAALRFHWAKEPAADFTPPVSLLKPLRGIEQGFYATLKTFFQQDYPAFEEAGARLVAASADTLESHEAFVEKLGGLAFPLASDADLSLARAYGIVDEDNKRSRRAVFVIDRDGTVLRRIDFYNPSNSSQYLDIFRALGVQG